MDEEQTPFKLTSVPIRDTASDEPANPRPPVQVPQRPIQAEPVEPSPDEVTPAPQPELPTEPVHTTPEPRLVAPKADHQSLFTLIRQKWWLFGAIVVAAIVTVYLAFTYMNASHQAAVMSIRGTSTDTSQMSNQAILAAVSKDLTLPNEAPSFVTVTDITKVKNQEFFKNAENGDVMLIFQRSGRGLLYRPSTHKVIEYGKVTFSGNNP